VCSGLNALFTVIEVVKPPIYFIGPKMIFGSVSLHFANLVHVKRCELCVQAWLHYFGIPKLWNLRSTPLDPKFRWKMQNLGSSQNALVWGAKVVKHLFLSNGPKMMFGSVLEHIANLRHVKRWKTRVSGLNAPFRGTKVVKQPFFSIGPKMISWCVSEDFANLRQVKRCKTCVWAWMHYFGVPKLWSIHSTPLDPRCCLGVFRCISQTFGM
jgi:hypothetical protein